MFAIFVWLYYLNVFCVLVNLFSFFALLDDCYARSAQFLVFPKSRQRGILLLDMG